MRSFFIDNIKNFLGRGNSRRIIAFAVDDYGNVRVESKQARQRMDAQGMKTLNVFDAYDSLETRDDLSSLFDTLTSVKDCNGNPAVFTCFSVPCNLNFDKIADSGYSAFFNELLPDTFAKASPSEYTGAWELWKEGINKGILMPAFHGREHLNLKVFKHKLAKRDPEVLTALQNRSYCSISSSEFNTISYTASYDFDKFSENESFRELIESGLDNFEKVFGFRTIHFNSPGGREHSSLHKIFSEGGVEILDAPFIKREHQGDGQYKKVVNFTGKSNSSGQVFCVRNCVFEPSSFTPQNAIDRALVQIERAFFWNMPAIISSHRVNFCGNISEDNRKNGLATLKRLLQEIVKKWPDVEFMSSTKICAELLKR